MPTLPKEVKGINELNTVDILNTARDEIGGTYADQIPEALKEGQTFKMASGAVGTVSSQESIMRLRAIGEVMTEFQPLANAFLTNIVNRIGRVIITSKMYNNPWSVFKKGRLENGETIEEIFVAIAKPFQFDPQKAEDEVFKRKIPDVRATFHSMNFQKVYKTTVSNDQLRQAFLSWQGITDLIAKIIEQVYTAAQYDEFLVMKYMIARLALEGKIYAVKIPTVTIENSRAVTTAMVAQARKLTYMGSTYNMEGVKTHTQPDELYTILTSDIESIFDVNVLALSFHMDKAELLGRQIGVDGFGTIDAERLEEIFEDDPYTSYTPFTNDELLALSSITALMADKDWFMIFDNYDNMTEIYNPQGLYWNYFYHTWKTFSVSPFNNAILFTEEAQAVLSVTVSPSAVTINKGQGAKFKADVETTGFAPSKVIWTLLNATSVDSKVNEGVVTIGADETAKEIDVIATSVFDDTKSGRGVITVA